MKVDPESSNNATVCQNNLCCNAQFNSASKPLSHPPTSKPPTNTPRSKPPTHPPASKPLSFPPASKDGGFFALGVFSGQHRENYTACNEVCAVVRCLSREQCGDGIATGSTVFRELYLQGNFSRGTFVFPTVLVDNAKLATSGMWNFIEENSALKMAGNQSGGLLVFGLYGRCFGRDPRWYRRVMLSTCSLKERNHPGFHLFSEPFLRKRIMRRQKPSV